jgi:hypothetical protein
MATHHRRCSAFRLRAPLALTAALASLRQSRDALLKIRAVGGQKFTLLSVKDTKS